MIFNGNTLEVSEEVRADVAPKGLFVPRTAASRPRAGIGHKKKAVVIPPSTQAAAPAEPGSSKAPTKSSGKGQDDFRKMLGGS